MTKQEAKELSLEVWRYLAEHPEIEDKAHLPDYLWRKIMRLPGFCPLCDLFKPLNIPPNECPCCPLKSCNQGLYRRWNYTTHDKNGIAIRKEAAQEIVKAIEAWDPEEAE
jgi:hypothetical protein